MKVYITILFFGLALLSCKKEASNTHLDYTYLGGEIINPNAKYIVLSKNKTVIDTVPLDKNNRFNYEIKDLTEGLYTFRHGGEYQLILLEARDSLLLRLNTLDFDESLVYSGKGNKKNNYFIDEFLYNEEEEKYIIKLCQLDATTFQKHIDSLKNYKLNALEKFTDKNKPSSLFLKIAKANIDYSYYASKEVYPFVHFGKNKAAILNALPANFYNYRKDINYNDVFLNGHHTYNKFLRYNLSNLSLKKHDNHETNACYNRESLCYNLDRLKIIDSLITNADIKDDLLFHFAMGYLSKSDNEENNNVLLTSYLNKSKSTLGRKKITHYTNSINLLKEGLVLPDIQITDYNNQNTNINALIKAPTVLCFWSQKYFEHFKESHYKLKELKVKYPEVDFITINIDDYGIEKSKKVLQNQGFLGPNEFKLKNPEVALDVLAIYPMTKTILIDSDKKIMNRNTNIFSIGFEEQLLGLINR